MKFEDIEREDVKECPICGVDDSEIMVEVEHVGVQVIYNICHNCDVAFQIKRIKDTDDYYKNQYRLILHDGQPNTEENVHEWNRAELVVTWLKKNLIHIDSCVDIGCATGIMLKMMKDVFNCKTLGVEITPDFAHYAKERYDIETVPTIEDVKEKFDLVTMVHFLEHCNDPNEYLQKAKELIADEGLLYIQVPDRAYRFKNTFIFHHPLAFSSRALNNLLEKNGFMVLANVMPCENISVLAEVV